MSGSSPGPSAVRPPTTRRLAAPRFSATKVYANLILVLLGAFFLTPLLWLATASVDAGASYQLRFPDFTLKNFAEASQPTYLRALGDSLLLSSIAAVVATVAAFFAAYSFSRHHIPWKGPILLTILFLSGVPVTILIVPVYKMFVYMGWLSLLPTAILLAATAIPFEIYLMTAGGPSNDTNILPVYSYLQGFKFYRLGYAALLGNVMVILSALIGAIFVFAGRSRRR